LKSLLWVGVFVTGLWQAQADVSKLCSLT